MTFSVQSCPGLIFDFKPVIRPLRREDIACVADMITELAKFHGDIATLTPSDLVRDALGQAPWARVLVVETDGGLIGYCVLHALYRTQSAERGLEVQHLFIVPHWRGKGIGRLLMTAIMEKARLSHCRYVTIGTRPDNVAAQAVYRHMGFEDHAQSGLRFRWRIREPV